jgi:DNA polymerase I-like protein with 3'-5' exonuclease and polymerase domains
MKPHKLTFQCGKCGGANAKKIHALMGMSLYPGNDYEQVKKSKSTAVDMYTNGKRGVFALLYGGTAFTIATKIGVSIEIAERALEDFVKKYLKVGIARSEVASRFTALRQPGGIGSKVIYSQPAEFVENIYGFKRFITLENLVIKRLFELSNNLPGSLIAAGKKLKVMRRDREQTGDNATRTALLAAAFAQQQANIRAAQNTVIQSSGAESTKALQVAICTIQPRGIQPWKVRAVQVHDSISVVSATESEVKEIGRRVQAFVDKLRERVPLLGIDWLEHANSWAD